MCCVCMWWFGDLVSKSYPALCNSMDCSPPDSSVHGILQARICHFLLQRISRDQTQVSCIAGRFFTHLDMKEALCVYTYKILT